MELTIAISLGVIGATLLVLAAYMTPEHAADVTPTTPRTLPSPWTGPVVPMRMHGCDTEIALLDLWRARGIARVIMHQRRRQASKVQK